jgi:hypothetical protein
LDFSEPGIAFIDNPILSFHLDLLSKKIEEFVSINIPNQKKLSEIEIKKGLSHNERVNLTLLTQ